MDSNEQKLIKAHALKAYPDEACGFVVKNNLNDRKVVPKDNASLSPRRAFLISPQDLLLEENIVAIYHSHPKDSSMPSYADKIYCSELQIPFIIYSVLNDDFYMLNLGNGV